MLCCVKGLPKRSILRAKVIVALLGARQLGLQSKEFTHHRLALCEGFVKLFFEQCFHAVKDSAEGA